MLKKLLVYLPIFIFSISLVYAIPGSWYGYVTLDSATAADGVIVDVYISGSIAATTTVGSVQSNGYYLIHVEGSSGDSVSFRIYGNNVSEAVQTWAAGFQHPAFNLTATSAANGAVCPTYSGYTSGTNVANLGCAGGYCVHDVCRAASTYCGDSYCDSGETCTSCSGDCGACTTGGGSSGGGGGGTTTTCTESWICTDWFACTIDGTQTRQCSDQNACGTYDNKPAETQTCIYIPPVETPLVEEVVLPPVPAPEPVPIPEPAPVPTPPPASPAPTPQPEPQVEETSTFITPLSVGAISIAVLSIIMLIVTIYLRRMRTVGMGSLKKLGFPKRKLNKSEGFTGKKQSKRDKESAKRKEMLHLMKESFEGEKRFSSEGKLSRSEGFTGKKQSKRDKESAKRKEMLHLMKESFEGNRRFSSKRR
ncbi:hypothetical protein KY342_03815 [Candidatus Woesearchaeota archaeon]|nr:hypothetical protein [Candidatus Woesearchaeota archaeon]